MKEVARKAVEKKSPSKAAQLEETQKIEKSPAEDTEHQDPAPEPQIIPIVQAEVESEIQIPNTESEIVHPNLEKIPETPVVTQQEQIIEIAPPSNEVATETIDELIHGSPAPIEEPSSKLPLISDLLSEDGIGYRVL